MTRRPTVGVRRGLRLIVDRVMEDFDNGFEHLFPDIDERKIMDLMEAADWLEQYAADEVEP
jgi:hypothetical protein